jgi:hypothetical protein
MDDLLSSIFRHGAVSQRVARKQVRLLQQRNLLNLPFLLQRVRLPDGTRVKVTINQNGIIPTYRVKSIPRAQMECLYGDPVFYAPYGETTPVRAFVGKNCSDGIGRLVIRDVLAWDGLLPMADHVTYGDDLAVVFERQGEAFWLKPEIKAHPCGVGVVGFAMSATATAYEVYIKVFDAAPDDYPIPLADLVEQTIIFEGAFSGQPTARVFSNNAIDWIWEEKRGHYISLGIECVQCVLETYTEIFPGVEFHAIIDNREWWGLLLLPWGNANVDWYDCNGDTYYNEADRFSVPGYANPLPATMFEVPT